MLGVTDDQLRLLTSLLVLIFLSGILKKINNPNLKYLFSFTIATLLQLYVYGIQIIPVYIQNLIVYGLLRLKLKNCGWIITLQSLIILSGYHIYGMIVNYGGWTMDASALLMINVCKYSLLAYAYQDGNISPEKQKLSQERLKLSIKQLPTFWQYLNYIQFLPTSIIGPTLEYSDFKKYIYNQQSYKAIPSSWYQTFQTFCQCLLCAGIYFLGDQFIPTSYIKTQNFLNQPLGYCYAYIWISLITIRFKYYFGWKLSICSIHASGVSYTDKENNFSYIDSVKVIQVQTNMHVRDKINYWNISVQGWLRKSIYQRSTFKNRIYSQLYVFMVSAFWHGFYTGYYFSFFFWFLQLYVQSLIFSATKSKNLFIKNIYLKISVNIILSMLVSFIFSLNASFFIALQGQICLKILWKIKFLPQIILLFGLIIFSLPYFKIKRQKKQIKRQQ